MASIVNFDLEKGFPLADVDLKHMAALAGGELIGKNIPVQYLASVNNNLGGNSGFLTYATTPAFLQMFSESNHEAAIIDKSLEKYADIALAAGKSLVIVEKFADKAFFSINEKLAQSGSFPVLNSVIGDHCRIHHSAVIYDHVSIGNNVEICPNVVIHPNTRIDDDAVIQSGSVIGGQGGEYKTINGLRKRATHIGGTYIGKNVEIGSLNTIDRHLIGFYTKLMSGTKTDNLVQIAHGCTIGKDCTISSSTEFSGSVIVGDGIWYGSNTCCKNQIRIGNYAFISLGSILINDVPDFARMIGNPTRHVGWMCKCHRHQLSFEGNIAECECGRKYELAEDETVHMLADISDY